jgi:DNA primase
VASTSPTVVGINISHPDRLIYPGLGISKLDLARYYERILRRDPWDGYWSSPQRVSAKSRAAVKRL